MEEDITVCDIKIWQQLYLSSIFKHQVWSYHGLMGKREQQSVGLIGILKKASEEKGMFWTYAKAS